MLSSYGRFDAIPAENVPTFCCRFFNQWFYADRTPQSPICRWDATT